MNIPSKEEAKAIIAKLLTEPIERKMLFEKCIQTQKLPQDVIKDRRPNQTFNKIKCMFGHALTELLNSGILVQKNGIVEYREKLDKKSTAENVKRDIKIDETLRRLLAKRAYTRKELLDAVAIEVKDYKPEVVKADAGRLLNEAVKNSDVVKKGDKYLLQQEAPMQTTAERKRWLCTNLSDVEFVDKTVQMLEAWYKSKGFTKLESKNIDGPNDGGIDGIIRGIDGMEYATKVIVQVKHKHNAKKPVDIVDVCQFCWVADADVDATQALFITSGKFDTDTKKFVKNYKSKYFKLIDGELWLKLADECGFQL